MRRSRFLIEEVLIVFFLFTPLVGMAQSLGDDLKTLRDEIQSLKDGQKAISNDLQEIKKLLSGRGAERSPIRDINTTLNVADAFSKGDKQARLTLIEFTDYQ